MANPKRKWSHARTGLKRANWKLVIPGMVDCPHCHSLMMSHKVCKTCGFYAGKEVIKMQETK